MPFDLSMWKLLVLGAIALLIFGPDKLPEIARDAGRMVRQLRGMAQAARTELKSELGDTIGDFDVADLNPRTFVRRHLLDGLDGEPTLATTAMAGSVTAGLAQDAVPVSAPLPPVQRLAAGEAAPFDPDAT